MQQKNTQASAKNDKITKKLCFMQKFETRINHYVSFVFFYLSYEN